MNDLIDRQDAINAMYRLEAEDIETYGCSIPEGFDSKPAIEALRALPSAEPERKKGRWIYDTERVTTDGLVLSQYHCSECGLQSVIRMNFCGYCGTEMSGGE